jgi:hypothetical protein
MEDIEIDLSKYSPNTAKFYADLMEKTENYINENEDLDSVYGFLIDIKFLLDDTEINKEDKLNIMFVLINNIVGHRFIFKIRNNATNNVQNQPDN